MNIYCDIDGALTDNGEAKWGNPKLDRIEKLKQLAKKHRVILWSGNGENYAKEFAIKYDIQPVISLGKPHLIIDDNPRIRPNWDKLINKPEYLDN